MKVVFSLDRELCVGSRHRACADGLNEEKNQTSLNLRIGVPKFLMVPLASFGVAAFGKTAQASNGNPRGMFSAPHKSQSVLSSRGSSTHLGMSCMSHFNRGGAGGGRGGGMSADSARLSRTPEIMSCSATPASCADGARLSSPNQPAL